MKYIDADRLKAEIEKERKKALDSTKRGGLTISDIATADVLAEVLLIIEQLKKEQPKVDYNEFEKLFDDFCKRNKGHHITSHDACMWFWELGLNARKKD